MTRTLPPVPDPFSVNETLFAALGSWTGHPVGGPVALLEALIDRWEVRA